jgi:hypothetical protein
MCFNAPVSLATYCIGMLGSWILYTYHNRRPEALFYGWVAHMQLIEFGLHLAQSPKYERLNTFITRIGIFVNHMEPYILYAAIKALEPRPDAPWKSAAMDATMLALLPPTLYFSRKIFSRRVPPTKRGGESRAATNAQRGGAPLCGRRPSTKLFWEWNYDGNNITKYYALFLTALVVLSLCGFPGRRGREQAAIAVGSYAISYIVYRDEKVVGSMWCFLAALVPWWLIATGV